MARTDNLVVGVFDNQAQAERAVADLWRAGFPRDHIDMVTRSQGVTEANPGFDREKDAADGAVVGAMAGASAGAVAGAVATMLIPGIGTVIGGGLLAGIIGGAALGAAGGTFVGPFIALEMDHDDAHHYAREVDEGRTVVLVKAYDRAEQARTIIQANGGRIGRPVTGAPAAVTPVVT